MKMPTIAEQDKATIAAQIDGVEATIGRCEQRLDAIERSLRLQELTERERDDLLDEEKTLQKQLDKHKSSVKSLRVENFKSMIVSCVILVVVYGVYYMMT